MAIDDSFGGELDFSAILEIPGDDVFRQINGVPEDKKGRIEELIAAGRYMDALEPVAIALGENPSDAHLLRLRGDCFYGLKMYTPALDSYNAAIKHDDSVLDVWYYHGLSAKFLALKDLEQSGEVTENVGVAVESFRKVVEMDPGHAKARFDLADLLVLVGQYDEAIEHAGFVISFMPEYAHAWGIRGVAYRENGQYAKALEDINQALKLAPDDAHLLHQKNLIPQEYLNQNN